MFVLTTLEETVRIMPNKLHLPPRESITEDLNEKLANKVIVDVGLCITLYDIIEVGESFLRQGDPAAQTRVKFRFVVFRPFIGETLIGKVRSCSRDGVHVSLGFFDDILLSPEYLPNPCKL
jgi:DNA-directed RNA polymerase III subunit RPC8